MIEEAHEKNLETVADYLGTLSNRRIIPDVDIGEDAGIERLPNETLGKYAQRVFGIHSFDDEWLWLFGSFWSDTPFNKAYHARHRIDAYLFAGGIPYRDPDMGEMMRSFSRIRSV